MKGISAADFALFRRRMLCVTDVEPNRLVNTPKGVVLFDPLYANHMYVRGIFVSENPCGWVQSVGYDAKDLRLDRDRMAFQEPETFMRHTSEIVGTTLNEQVNNPQTVPLALQLVNRVFNVTWAHLRYLYQFVNPAVVDLFWNKFEEFHPESQPMSVHQTKDENGKEEYMVAIKFPRLYLSVDYYLLQVLRKSQNFRSPNKWLSEVIQRAPFVYPAAEQQEINDAINRIRAMPHLNLNNVVVLQDEGHHNYISCVKDSCLYIPHSQINKEKDLLAALGPTNTPIGRAVELLALRCGSSDTCVQL